MKIACIIPIMSSQNYLKLSLNFVNYFVFVLLLCYICFGFFFIIDGCCAQDEDAYPKFGKLKNTLLFFIKVRKLLQYFSRIGVAF